MPFNEKTIDNKEVFIISNFKKMRIKDIATKLNCSTSYVSAVARRFGLYKNIGWNDNCDKFLKDNHQAMSTKEMANALNCSTPTVLSALDRLELQRPAPTKNRHWSDEHDALVKEKFEIMTIVDIAKELGFSRSVVQKSAIKQGLCKYVKWDNKCDDYLILHYRKMSMNDIAENLCASLSTVFRQAKRLKQEKRIPAMA